MTAGIAGLVLAAGAGRRFGGPKALARLEGESFLERAVRVLAEGGCDPVLAVVPDPPPAGLAAGGALLVPNPDSAAGMGTSLRLGLRAAQGEAVVVLLVDTPLVGPEAVRRVRAAHAHGAQVAVATYEGRHGHPVLLGRGSWGEVGGLAVGDVGARPHLAAHPELIVEVPCDGTGDPADIDTADDLQRLHRRG